MFLCNVLTKRSRRSLTIGDFSFFRESIYNRMSGSVFKPAIRLFMVKPLGTASGVRTVTPSPASTAAKVPDKLGYCGVELLLLCFSHSRRLGQLISNVGPIRNEMAQRKGWLEGVGELMKGEQELSPFD
jgi:hypothetical protein